MSRFRGVAASTLVVLVVAGGAALAQPKAADDPVVARVNGSEIRRSQVFTAIESLPEQYRSMPVAQLFEPVLSRLVEGKLLAQAAEKAKMGDEDEVKKRVALAREQVLRDVYLSREVDKSLSDDKLRAYYDRTVKSQPAADEVKARHILVKTEREAQSALEEIKKGADFAEASRRLSTGPTATNGGDLGWFTKEQMVPEFAEAAFALKPGEVSKAPFMTQFGWHIVKVEDRRTAPVPSFEDTRADIRETLSREAVGEILANLRKDAKIEQFDANGAVPAPAMQLAPKK